MGLPVLRLSSSSTHAVTNTPAEPQAAFRSHSPVTTAFPVLTPGRLPHHPFRGLLSVHSHYGLRGRQVPYRTLYTRGFSRFVTSTTAPVATGRSESCRTGFAPAERQRLGTAHKAHGLRLEEELRVALKFAEYVQKAAIHDVLGPEKNEWETNSIGNAFQVVTGGTPNRNTRDYWNGDVPWVKTGEVNYRLITESEEYITHKGLKESPAKLCPSGSVLIALYGQGPTRGRVGMLGIQATVNQACAAILPRVGFDPWFVYYYLCGQYLSLRAMAQGAAQPNLNLAMIKSFPIPTLPLNEQQECVRTIAAIAAAKDKVQIRLRSLSELKERTRKESFG
jgi:hypothetical protein